MNNTRRGFFATVAAALGVSKTAKAQRSVPAVPLCIGVVRQRARQIVGILPAMFGSDSVVQMSAVHRRHAKDFQDYVDFFFHNNGRTPKA